MAEPGDETAARAGDDDCRGRGGHAADAGGRAGWIDVHRRVLKRLNRGGRALATRRRDRVAGAPWPRRKRSQGIGSSAAILPAMLGVLKNDSSTPAMRA